VERKAYLLRINKPGPVQLHLGLLPQSAPGPSPCRHPSSRRSRPRLSLKCRPLIDPADRKTIERSEKMRPALLLASSWKQRRIVVVSRAGACSTARGRPRELVLARELRQGSARETCAVGDVGDVAEVADERDPALVPVHLHEVRGRGARRGTVDR